MPDHADAYRGIRERVTELTADLDAATAEQLTPAAPDWRVKDVLAHLVGVNADVIGGNIEGAGSDPWTKAQVDARRDHTIDELLAEWAEASATLEEIFPAIPDGPRGQLIFDALTHEYDLRGALGQPGARDTEAATIGFGWAVDVVTMLRDGADAGGLRIQTDFGEHVAGTGEVTATVRADRFELYRALTGRRSPTQIAAYDWDGGEPAPQIPLIGGRDTDLVE